MVVVGLFKPVVEAGSVKDVFANGDFSYLAPVYKLIKTDDAFFLLELINILIEFLFGHVTNHFFKLFFLDGLSILFPVLPAATTLFILVTHLLLVTPSS